MLRSVCLMAVLFFSAQLQASTQLFKMVYPYALLSDVAYSSVDKIRSLVEAQGYQLDYAAALPGYEVAYFIASNAQSHQQIISVRGSTNLDHVMLNMAVRLVFDPHIGIRLHQGFGHTAAALYQDARPHLKPGYTISTTGHSLGGAVALILAMHLNADNYKLDKIITFGQPKVTDMNGAQRYTHLNILRVTTEKDPVPLFPPFSIMDMKMPEVYWHVGNELLLYPGFAYSQLSAGDSMLRAADLFTQMPDENNIRHHYMSSYLKLLVPKLSNAAFVPYKSMANPLNWIF